MPATPTEWQVEFTETAARSLRGLPREDQSQIASVVRGLLADGLPPALKQEAERYGFGSLILGSWMLTCVEFPEQRRIVIITISPRDPSTGRAWREGIRAMTPNWIDRAMRMEWLGSATRDLRLALRSLRRQPGFSLTAVLTLALGIGATAAIFSVANGVLLTPLPYADADRVVTVWSSWSDFPDQTWVSFGEYQYYTQQNRTLDDVGLYQSFPQSFTSPENPERVRAAAITPNVLSILGVQPVEGRPFAPEAGLDSIPSVLIGYELWQRRYGGDRSVVGSSVELNGVMTPVQGVLPRGFALPIDFGSASESEVFFPLFIDVETPAQVPQNGGSHGSYVVARLAPGETVANARADLEELTGRLEAEGIYPAEWRFRPVVRGVMDDIVGTARSTIFVLLGAVAFLLLIACGNVASLLLSRSEARAGEVAVRTAMGAARGRILRQLLTESLVLAVLGGGIGLVLAYASVDVLLSIDPTAVPRSDAVTLDGTVLAATAGAVLLATLIFGAAPALRASGTGMGSILRSGETRGTRHRHSSRAQALLVMAQMAMAVVLLTGSVLMMRTFVQLNSIDTGFDAENVLTLRVVAPAARYADLPSVVAFYDRLLDDIAELPGVESVGASRLLPLASTMGTSGFRPVGYVPSPGETTQADWQWATPGYIQSMGISVIEGRAFEPADRTDGRPVVLVNESLAHRFWGEESPLGAAVTAGGGDTAVVVGVVGNVRHNGITEDVKARFYRPHAQITGQGWLGTARAMTLAVKGGGDVERLIPAVRQVVREADPTMPISELQTLEQVRSASVAQPRFAMVLMASFAIIALALASIGIYGVLAYSVSRRTREISIRIAMGAEQRNVVGMVVRQGLVLAVVGVTVGASIAWFVTRLMDGLLYQIEPQDPVTFGAVIGLFVAVAAIASWVPANRAAHVPPASALRGE